MRLVQISDSHLSGDQPTRTAELEACVRRINAFDPLPDVVVHTGDVAHNGLIEEYGAARSVLDTLKARYFVLAGNRDKRRALAEVFADGCHIQRGMDFIHYAIEDFETRLICLDTVCESSNKGQFCAARLAHLEALLMAQDDQRDVVLLLHHPPFEVGVGPHPFQFEDWAEAEALQALIGRHKRIRALYCGHVHRQFETILGPIPACVATSIATDLRWDDVTNCIYDRSLTTLMRNGVAPQDVTRANPA